MIDHIKAIRAELDRLGCKAIKVSASDVDVSIRYELDRLSAEGVKLPIVGIDAVIWEDGHASEGVTVVAHCAEELLRMLPDGSPIEAGVDGSVWETILMLDSDGFAKTKAWLDELGIKRVPDRAEWVWAASADARMWSEPHTSREAAMAAARREGYEVFVTGRAVPVSFPIPFDRDDLEERVYDLVGEFAGDSADSLSSPASALDAFDAAMKKWHEDYAADMSSGIFEVDDLEEHGADERGRQRQPAGPDRSGSAMTKEELALMLTGSEYGSEMTDGEVSAAAAAGLVVVFGASDDLMEFRGAIDDEIDCYTDDAGVAVVVAPSGTVKRLDKASPAEQVAGSVIKAKWAAEPGYSWTYETEIEHATFEIVEDGEPYCRGIVFDLKSIGATGTKRKRLKVPALGDGDRWTIRIFPDLFLAEAVGLWMEEAEPGDKFTIELVEMTDAEADALPEV